MTDIDIDAIRQREQAATKGPWGWRGHISQSVELRALHSGGLRIISTSRSEPCIGYTDDESLVLLDNSCKACINWLTGGGIGRGDDLKCEKPENLDTVWTWDPAGFIRPINDWAKAEVLEWSNHMYRDDVKGTTHPDAEFIAHARTDVPALLAKVDELTAERDEYAADNTRVVAQLVAANRHADGLEADLRSANTANTEYANENARLRSQLDSFEALLNQTQDRLVEAREQLFAQKPVIEAAEAWAEMRETDDVTPTEARKLAGALHDAIEQHRLMDVALTSARAEQPAEATR